MKLSYDYIYTQRCGLKPLELSQVLHWFFKPVLVIALLFMSTTWLHAQVTVKGIVTDKQGVSLPGVTILEKGSTNSTSTDNDGVFALEVSSPSSILVVSFVGMKTQEIPVGDQASITVELSPASEDLSEVVVIGYGSQSRETVTTSISKLDNAVLENVPYANAASALQGSLSGVRVQSVSGQPGAAPRVIVRGGTSINNPNGSSPLYIIDGITRGDMNNLNSNEIESIQVLKDAAATAIYGARGSNGVVIITTKSGKAGSTIIRYNYDLSVSDLREKYDLVNARDYIYFQRLGIAARGGSNLAKLALPGSAGTGNDLTKNTAFTPQYLSEANKHKLNEGWESMPDPIDPSKTIIFKNTDFQDVLFNTAYSNNHALSASGGTEKARFNMGLGYLANEGIAISSDYKRLSLNLNGDLQVSEKLGVFGRIMYSNTNDRQVFGSTANMFGRSLALPPTAKYLFEDGSLAPGLSSTLGNPEYYAGTQDAKNTLENLSMIVGGQWKILPDLTFDPQISLYRVAGDNRLFQRAYFNGPTQYIDSRTASGSYSKMTQHQLDAVFTYQKSFLEKHNLNAKLGFSYFGTNNAALSASGRGAASDLIPTLNGAAEPVSVGGSESEQKIIGYFTRVNYDFDQKYLLSLNLRYDGASNLGNTHKWGLFPGVSAGWNLHKEGFWSSMPNMISQLKLRASYGVNGNISGLGAYEAQGQYSVGSRYGGDAAIQNTVLSNPDLKWEQSKTFDIGADIGFANNRITVMVDYYRRVTDNLLTSFALPQSTGFGSILTNLGSLENKGLEIELGAQVLPSTSKLQWNLSFNASKVKNKILELPMNGVENNRIGGDYVFDPARGDYAWLGGLQEGGRLGDIYSYKQLGIYATDEEAANGPKDTLVPLSDKTKYGGDVNWLDLDENGEIDSRDRVYVGNIYPTWTGGFSNSLSYGNFGLFVRLDYTTGHTIYNYTEATSVGQFQGENGLSTAVLRSWQNPGDVTDIPRIYWADQQERSNLYRGNSEYYESGDFLALREVTLSYLLPKKLMERIKLNAIRLNVTANNLHYFTNYRGLNPEEGGTDNGRYPIPRSIIFGASVTF